MIDFGSIRTHRGSQNLGFEELVVQLVRRRPPTEAKEYRRIEGAGGDAGVEALWLLQNGSEIGVQAKYFLRVRDIDWAQIDRSVRTALERRSSVSIYRIALACDLTDKGGAKGRGRSGWESWDAHVSKWKKWASELGMTVEFQPVTASDLTDWLAQPNAAGLARYWFDTDFLSLDWFAAQVRAACADLADRYTPDQNVTVSASSSFDGLARSSKLRLPLLEALNSLRRHELGMRNLELPEGAVTSGARMIEALAQVALIEDEIPADPSRDCMIDHFLSLVTKAQDALKEFDFCLSRVENPHGSPRNDGSGKGAWKDTDRWQYRLRKADDAIDQIHDILKSSAFQCDVTRVLILTGEAGAGKSHLLATEANRALFEGRPAILFLGQQFSQGHPWEQCVRSLGLTHWSRADLFGALDAAGEAFGARTMVLVDAVNEGVGARFWKSYVSGFLEQVRPYRFIAVAIACRTEYVPFAIPQNILGKFPRVELRGFITFEEQEDAAIQYLDRRGIVRPAGPLLAPEFSHPLFLKATSDALIARREFVYPRGLRGALKILRFYLESVGVTLLPSDVEPSDLSKELRKALANLAAEMVATMQDFVPLSRGQYVVSDAFGDRPPPPGMTWLDVLIRNGIVRRDPDPSLRFDEEFSEDREVIRVAFQRFLDLLVAASLLKDAASVDELFEAGGKLDWFLERKNRHRWPGLIYALSILLPEEFGVELIDAFPGDWRSWWNETGFQEGFRESVRWRATRTQGGLPAFSSRSFELLNSLSLGYEHALALLLELAVVPEHPWNSQLIHQNLWRWKLPDGDVRWSRPLAYATEDLEHPIHRIISWVLNGRLELADGESLRLVGIVLCWTFSTTSRPIRDRATRGLTRVLVNAPKLYHHLLKTFISIDDLYVVERLLAAAYGAACQIRDQSALEAMASSTFDLVFASGRPPRHLLTRDYALAILQLSASLGKLEGRVDLSKATPPFPNAGSLRAPSSARLEKRTERVGGQTIYGSCGGYGDFGCYKIVPSVERFSATPLSAAPPLSFNSKLMIFEEEVVRRCNRRLSIWDKLREKCVEVLTPLLEWDGNSVKVVHVKAREALEAATDLEDKFVRLLSDEEKVRYNLEIRRQLLHLGDGGIDRQPPAFNAGWAQRWVTNRVFSLGWDKRRIGDDHVPGGVGGRRRPLVERIGKKYQWIALSELLAWLSDTHWVKSDWDEIPKLYEFPIDAGFQRDLDPTLYAEGDIEPPPPGDWWQFEMTLPEICDSDLHTWVASDDPWQDAQRAIFLNDRANAEWITLYTFQVAREEHPERMHKLFSPKEITTRREAFLFVQSLLLSREDAADAYEIFKSARLQNSMELSPVGAVDGPFWGEVGWRGTWSGLDWQDDLELLEGIRVLKPVAEYTWESYLDASRPDGVRLRLPVPELIGRLDLDFPIPQSPFTARDKHGEIILVDYEARDEARVSVVVKRDAFSRLLTSQDLACLWYVFGERSAWPDGRLDTALRRWFGRVLWFDGMKSCFFEWEAPWGGGS